MWTVKQMICNPLQENCYVVSDETGECVVIDCGAFYQEEKSALKSYIRNNALKPVHLLATHGHLDHNFGNADLWHDYGLKVEVCADDQSLVEALAQQAADILEMDIDIEQPPTGRLLHDGDTVTFGNHTLKVLCTPGHTPGSVLFYCELEATVFTGDTLFRMSIGRTDFAEGSWTEMECSLNRIVRDLPQTTRILPGHGPATTMAEEVKHNPYLRM